MYIEVPEQGLKIDTSEEFKLTQAELGDVEEMVDLENRLCGIKRRKDFEYFIKNNAGIWNTVICRSKGGKLIGFLSSVNHPASKMIGPGVGENDKIILECLQFSLKNSVVNLLSSFFLLVQGRQYKLLIHGVQKTAKFISPSATENTNHLGGL